MSMELSSERVCYISCNYCNTMLAVSVPFGSMFTMVTVRCGHCANLLTVNMGTMLQSTHLQDFQVQKQQSIGGGMDRSTSNGSRYGSLQLDTQHPKMPPIRPPEKRQRVPSAYNRFIKEEIQRIKASNPEISHREAFSTAAKNWAHFPHIHFGLKVEGNKQAKMDHPVAGEATAQKSLGF